MTAAAPASYNAGLGAALVDDLGIAVIGLGMGMTRAQQVVDTPGARLAAVADLRPERRAAAAARFGCPAYDSLDELLERAEGVECCYVMTESGHHGEHGLAAARAGKHIISTKPIEITVDKALAFCRGCREAAVELLVDFQMRYEPAVAKMRAAVEQGALGRPLFGEVKLKWWRGEDYYQGWHGTWDLDGGGSIMNQAIHFLDILLYVLGDVKEVFAYSGTAAHVNCQTEDLTSAVLQFANGAQGVIQTTTCYPGTQHDLVEIHGTHGAVAVDLNHLRRWEFIPPNRTPGSWNPATGSVEGGGGGGPYDPPLDVPTPLSGAVADAVNVIRHGGAPACSGPQAIKAVALAQALYESARSGQPARPAAIPE